MCVVLYTSREDLLNKQRTLRKKVEGTAKQE